MNDEKEKGKQEKKKGNCKAFCVTRKPNKTHCKIFQAFLDADKTSALFINPKLILIYGTFNVKLKEGRKMEEETKSFRNRNIKLLLLYANLQFNLTSKMNLLICDIT